MSAGVGADAFHDVESVFIDIETQRGEPLSPNEIAAVCIFKVEFVLAYCEKSIIC